MKRRLHRRLRNVYPFIEYQNGNPTEDAVERDQMGRMEVTGHFRWLG